MSVLFSPFRLRSLTLPNRIVFPPLSQYSAQNDCSPGPWHLQHYGSLAASGVGMVVVEDTTVEPQGLISKECLGLWSQQQEEELGRLARGVRECGGSKLGIQLGHAGRRASAYTGSHGKRPLPQHLGGWQPIAPSSIPYQANWQQPIAMDSTHIARVQAAFVSSAERADRAGFDCLELHYAHGFLMHQFLSPITNHRTDQYGGTLENRVRFPLDVIRAVRAVWPEEKPLGVRISATEWVEGGFNLNEAVQFAKEAKQAGVDFICVSSGGNDPKVPIPLAPGYHLPFSHTIRTQTPLTTRTVGLIVSPHLAESAISEGKADLIAVGRGLVNDIRWVWRAAIELGVKLDYPPQYRLAKTGGWIDFGKGKVQP